MANYWICMSCVLIDINPILPKLPSSCFSKDIDLIFKTYQITTSCFFEKYCPHVQAFHLIESTKFPIHVSGIYWSHIQEFEELPFHVLEDIDLSSKSFKQNERISRNVRPSSFRNVSKRWFPKCWDFETYSQKMLGILLEWFGVVWCLQN